LRNWTEKSKAGTQMAADNPTQMTADDPGMFVVMTNAATKTFQPV
jgi:hypothetical protein